MALISIPACTLYYKSEGATYPYIYVPIAEFQKVGAQVLWDNDKQVMTVTTDYGELKSKVNTLTNENQYLSSLIEEFSMEGLGNTVGNIINSGFIAKEDDWLYFNKRQETSLYGALSKVKTDLTMDTQLVLDEPLYINVLNEWVFFRNGKDNGKIYKIKTDGTEETKLSDDSSTGIVVSDDWLYYANQSDGGKFI